MMSIIDHLTWRYATKEFSDRRIEPVVFDRLLEAVRLAPSSYGQQPYRIVVVEDVAVRQRLVGAARGKERVASASHLLVFAVDTQLGRESIQDYVEREALARGTDPVDGERFAEFVAGVYAGKGPEGLVEWAARQAYLALGLLLTVCAMEEVDACPMEGIDPEGFDDVLGLAARGLRTAVVCALGYRSESDAHALQAKVRKSSEALFLRV